jgi:hypothetical protein
MPEKRTFMIVLVNKNKGTGTGITENPDKIVQYSGDTQTIQCSSLKIK